MLYEHNSLVSCTGMLANAWELITAKAHMTPARGEQVSVIVSLILIVPSRVLMRWMFWGPCGPSPTLSSLIGLANGDEWGLILTGPEAGHYPGKTGRNTKNWDSGSNKGYTPLPKTAPHHTHTHQRLKQRRTEIKVNSHTCTQYLHSQHHIKYESLNFALAQSNLMLIGPRAVVADGHVVSALWIYAAGMDCKSRFFMLGQAVL